LEHALSRRHPGAALFIFDLDDFKQVNDTHGHAAGDEVLVAVARPLNDCVRDQDTVARLGGEFAIVLEGGFGRASGARLVAARAPPPPAGRPAPGGYGLSSARASGQSLALTTKPGGAHPRRAFMTPNCM
jgi:GGDEF domain-containing protein